MIGPRDLLPGVSSAAYRMRSDPSHGLPIVMGPMLPVGSYLTRGSRMIRVFESCGFEYTPWTLRGSWQVKLF
jgi:hypothetical protein